MWRRGHPVTSILTVNHDRWDPLVEIGLTYNAASKSCHAGGWLNAHLLVKSHPQTLQPVRVLRTPPCKVRSYGYGLEAINRKAREGG
jgi:hypothetical protein